MVFPAPEKRSVFVILFRLKRALRIDKSRSYHRNNFRALCKDGNWRPRTVSMELTGVTSTMIFLKKIIDDHKSTDI
jgi:hypothetical protein